MPKVFLDLDDELNLEVVNWQLINKEKTKPQSLLKLVKLGLQKSKEEKAKKQQNMGSK